MAPISYDNEHIHFNIDVKGDNVGSLTKDLTVTEAGEIVNAIGKLHPQILAEKGVKLTNVVTESNLKEWRTKFIKIKSNQNKLALMKMEKIIKLQRKQGKETDDFFEFPCGIKVSKKGLDIEGAEERKMSSKIYKQKLADYDGKEKSVTYVSGYTISRNTQGNEEVKELIQQGIEKYKNEGWRPATTNDILTIIEFLPGNDESEKLISMQMAIGHIGTILLGPAFTDIHLELAHNSGGYPTKLDSQHTGDGQILFVQDCDYKAE